MKAKTTIWLVKHRRYLMPGSLVLLALIVWYFGFR
tara:strand:- start:4104 stop:4208 length:105 start_codon:yes stop_codon:yes gene_type:complete